PGNGELSRAGRMRTEAGHRRTGRCFQLGGDTFRDAHGNVAIPGGHRFGNVAGSPRHSPRPTNQSTPDVGRDDGETAYETPRISAACFTSRSESHRIGNCALAAVGVDSHSIRSFSPKTVNPIRDNVLAASS